MKTIRFVAVVWTVTAGVALSACSQQASPTSPSLMDGTLETSSTASRSGDRATVASAPASDPAAANFEVRFMMNMIDHHMMAVMMADVCLSETLIHAELAAMCADIKSSQMAEITTMQTWLQQWYGITYAPTMKPGDQKMIDRLAALSGAEFEIEFMEMMIRHHAKAIKEGEHCLDRAEHEQLLQLCANIVETQSAEIAQMEMWLCQWYDRCQRS